MPLGEGGVIAITVAHQTEDMTKAVELMSSNCGNDKYKVTDEGEVVTGTTTEGDATQTHKAGTASTQAGTLFGIPITSGGSDPSNSTRSTSTTTAVKEWQVTYECKTAQAMAPSGSTPVAKKKTK